MSGRKVAYLGVLTALAIVLGWLDSLIPVAPFAPGVKLGLANVVTLLTLYRFGWREASVVNLLRIGLSGILFGNLSMALYSLAGAALSLIVMALLKRTERFTVTGVSVAGGVSHNVGQILIAVWLMETKLFFYYLPILALTGLASGALVGLLGAWLQRRLPPG